MNSANSNKQESFLKRVMLSVGKKIQNIVCLNIETPKQNDSKFLQPHSSTIWRNCYASLSQNSLSREWFEDAKKKNDKPQSYKISRSEYKIQNAMETNPQIKTSRDSWNIDIIRSKKNNIWYTVDEYSNRTPEKWQEEIIESGVNFNKNHIIKQDQKSFFTEESNQNMWDNNLSTPIKKQPQSNKRNYYQLLTPRIRENSPHKNNSNYTPMTFLRKHPRHHEPNNLNNMNDVSMNTYKTQSKLNHTIRKDQADSLNISMKSLSEIKNEISSKSKEQSKKVEKIHKIWDKTTIDFDYEKDYLERNKIWINYYNDKAEKYKEVLWKTEKEKQKKEDNFHHWSTITSSVLSIKGKEKNKFFKINSINTIFIGSSSQNSKEIGKEEFKCFPIGTGNESIPLKWGGNDNEMLKNGKDEEKGVHEKKSLFKSIANTTEGEGEKKLSGGLFENGFTGGTGLFGGKDMKKEEIKNTDDKSKDTSTLLKSSWFDIKPELKKDENQKEVQTKLFTGGGKDINKELDDEVKPSILAFSHNNAKDARPTPSLFSNISKPEQSKEVTTVLLSNIPESNRSSLLPEKKAFEIGWSKSNQIQINTDIFGNKCSENAKPTSIFNNENKPQLSLLDKKQEELLKEQLPVPTQKSLCNQSNPFWNSGQSAKIPNVFTSPNKPVNTGPAKNSNLSQQSNWFGNTNNQGTSWFSNTGSTFQVSSPNNKNNNNINNNKNSLFSENNCNHSHAGGCFCNSSANNTGNASALFNSNPMNNNTGNKEGLFGNNALNNTVNTGGLFGNNASNNTVNTGGLFGNNASNNTGNTGGLFGNNVSNNTGNKEGLFGNNASNNTVNSGGLFGNNASNNTVNSGGLFGNNASNNTVNSGGLFGNSASNNTGGLFGNSASNNNGNNGGLFGNSASNNNGNTGGILSNNSSNNNGNTGGILSNNSSNNNGNTGGILSNSISNPNNPNPGSLFNNNSNTPNTTSQLFSSSNLCDNSYRFNFGKR